MYYEGTNETLHKGLYYEWLSSLLMYQEELVHLNETVSHVNYKGAQPDASIELDALKELIKIQQFKIEALSDEIAERRKQAGNGPTVKDGVIAFSEVIKNNQLREKIRKAEHSVFYLKYHVNKLLSLAS